MNIATNLQMLKTSTPDGIKIIAVSKTKPPSAIMEAYEAGQKSFGENRAQELSIKQKELPKDIEWHMIGHLQSNKVKNIASFVDYIHSVDSIKLLETINSLANNHHRTINCLLQVHIAQETNKYGYSPDEIKQLFSSNAFNEYHNINIVGLMGMATFTTDSSIIRLEFNVLRQLFEGLKQNYGHIYPNFKELSTGMSGDYSIAIEQGSTMIRIGSKIFGKRN
jgi:hypothetical protein